jgi:hypothetical protein
MRRALLWLRRTGIGLAGAVIVSLPAGIWLWQDRNSIEDIDLRRNGHLAWCHDIAFRRW